MGIFLRGGKVVDCYRLASIPKLRLNARLVGFNLSRRGVQLGCLGQIVRVIRNYCAQLCEKEGKEGDLIVNFETLQFSERSSDGVGGFPSGFRHTLSFFLSSVTSLSLRNCYCCFFHAREKVGNQRKLV